FFIFIFIAILGVTVQSTVFSYFPIHYLQPDLLLIMCVYAGFHRNNIEGGIFAILCAMIAENNSTAAESYSLVVYVFVFVISKILSRAVVVPDLMTSTGIVAGLSLFKKLVLLALLAHAGKFWNSFESFLIYLIPGVAVQAALTPVVFTWLNRVDLRTYKDSHADDEYQFSNRELK
ncbi:MAG TPA: hypothetical protein PLH57_09875, partial [Oligoflexia bacterium]|nr:hypothetical protein [Oligoflexia bacterium]